MERVDSRDARPLPGIFAVDYLFTSFPCPGIAGNLRHGEEHRTAEKVHPG